jgi:hypothetical protein
MAHAIEPLYIHFLKLSARSISSIYPIREVYYILNKDYDFRVYKDYIDKAELSYKDNIELTSLSYAPSVYQAKAIVNIYLDRINHDNGYYD